MASNVEYPTSINEDYDDGTAERQPFLNGGQQKNKYRYSIEIDHQSANLESKKWEFAGWGKIDFVAKPLLS